jgi:hypothetical protein
MKKIVQTYPTKYNTPDVVLYDHPDTECEHGTEIIEFSGKIKHMGHTKTEKGWTDYYNSI